MAELIGCHHTGKKRLEEKDCKQPKEFIMQILRQDKEWPEAHVFLQVCEKTALPTVAQRPVGRTGDLAHLLGILARHLVLNPFLLVTIYIHHLQGRLESGSLVIFSHFSRHNDILELSV